MSIKHFIKNYLIEQDENLVQISPDEYIELLDDVGGIADRISKLKPYRGKSIVITGPIDLSDRKNIGPLTGVERVMGRLDISNSNVPHINGITVDGYTSDYGSTMWRIKMQKQLDNKLVELDQKRQEDEWDVENGDDDSERTEALYENLRQNGEIDMVEDEEGNEIPEDKYFIYPSGRATYGYGKQYEWLGGGNGFNPNTYDVYTEEEAANYFKLQDEATQLPYIYLSAGVSAKLFQDTLKFAHDSGAKFNGVLCGRATWANGVEIFTKEGEKAAIEWLNTVGKKNIEELNEIVKKTATSWKEK